MSCVIRDASGDLADTFVHSTLTKDASRIIRYRHFVVDRHDVAAHHYTMADGIKIITTNRRARRNYHITETLEAGLVLYGTEVKALREGRANLQDAYGKVDNDEVFLLNAHISPYSHGNLNNHDPLRPRKLLLHKREIGKLKKAAEQKGFTIIPLKLYFKNGIAKVEIGLARGKKLYDKRTDIAERDTQRRIDRTMKQY